MAKKTVRVFLLSRRVALAVGAVLAAAAIFGAVHIPAAVSAAGTARQLPIYSVERPSEEGEKFCAISFDAAWGNEDTQMLLDILARYDVRATFFLVGDWVDKYPDMVQAIAERGHEIGNHSAHHPGWRIWFNGCPGGEDAFAVRRRLTRVVERVRDSGVDKAICFGHGHSSRVLALAWLDWPIIFGQSLPVEVASVSVLGREKESWAVLRWNS